jgi:hypothetical protein
MKKSTIWKSFIAIAFLMAGFALHAQSPATVNDGSSTLAQFGLNSAGNASAHEYVDSLTTGAASVKYLVYPDSTLSPLYNFTTSATANLNSHFVWSVAPGAGVTIDTVNAGYASNYALISYPTPGALPANYVLSVYEKVNSGSCVDATPRSYAVRLINIPTVTGGTAPGPQCSNTPVVTFAIPVTLTSDLAVAGLANRVRVNYTITGPGAYASGPTDVDLDKTATSFNVTLTGATTYGVYTITINSVSDRISRKSAVAGTITTGTMSLIVNKVPVTGPVYHIPNI